MRDRYYVRTDKVKKALEKAQLEAYRAWTRTRKVSILGNPLNGTVSLTEFKRQWMLEKHNIVVSNQANGVTKLGFASKGDMLLFVLRFA